MERVAFLLEDSGERIMCLLNPNTILIRRSAGIRPRQTTSGNLSGPGMRDDPLLYTGGGRTEMQLDLLFDVALAGSTIAATDVRELTNPIWELSENSRDAQGLLKPPVVRFIWGKVWNIPGVVSDVAERLERFQADGAPERSWIRLRFLRVDEPRVEPALTPEGLPLDMIEEIPAVTDGPAMLHETMGGGDTTPPEEDLPATTTAGERLDELSYRYYGVADLWRILASANNLEDPLQVPSGTVIYIPPASTLKADK
jgi:hypothetical protein